MGSPTWKCPAGPVAEQGHGNADLLILSLVASRGTCGARGGEDDCPWVGHCKPPIAGRASEPGEGPACVWVLRAREGKAVVQPLLPRLGWGHQSVSGEEEAARRPPTPPTLQRSSQAWSYPEHSSGIRPLQTTVRKPSPCLSTQTLPQTPNSVPPPGSQAAQEAWAHQRPPC